jgi:glycosyltransferase involved in cell wall biosynthesis
MKIVHLEDFIHPDAGYQVNLLGRLQIHQGHDVKIVTGELEKIPEELTAFFGRDNIERRDARFEEETGVKIYRVPLYGFYSGRAIYHPIKLVRKILLLKPDVLFVHGEDTLTGIIFILISRWLPFPIVLDCHMLEMASMNKYREYFRFFYKRLITPVILRHKIPLIRVVDSDFVQKCLGIPLSHTDLLSLGTDTDHFRPNLDQRSKMRAELGLSHDSYLVVYAGKLDEHKGGKLLAEAVCEKIFSKSGKIIEFLIIGNTVGEYGKAVEKQLLLSKNKIVRLPTQRYFELAKYYQTADLAIYPKQCSLSFFEVQACGVPVLFEENEINNQRMQRGNAFSFKPGSVSDFRTKMIELSSLSSDDISRISRISRDYVVETYDFVPIAQRYTNVLQRALDMWNSTRKPRDLATD